MPQPLRGQMLVIHADTIGQKSHRNFRRQVALRVCASPIP
jgi:hypothetical protein